MNNQTIEKLKSMRLHTMAELHHQTITVPQQVSYSNDEYLALLADAEWEMRHTRKTQRLLKQAQFKQKASIVDIDYTVHRNLDKSSFTRITTLDFIKNREHLLITGPSGVGKSYLAQALGHQACLLHFKVLYENCSRLFNKLKLTKVDGTYLTELKKIAKKDLLIIDDFGLKSLDNFSREAFMDIIEDRYDSASIIIASQLPVSSWYDIIGEGTIADAILDRIVHAAHKFNLNGESMRKRKMRTNNEKINN